MCPRRIYARLRSRGGTAYPFIPCRIFAFFRTSSRLLPEESPSTATDRRLSAGEGRRIAVEYSMSIPVRLVSGSSFQILH